MRAGATAAMLLLLGAASAAAAPKKVAELEAKRAAAGPPAGAVDRRLRARLGRPPAPLVSVRNLWTHEVLAVPADRRARVDVELWSWFLRCHYTDEPTRIDPSLIQALLAAARRFDKTRVDVVSGYRAPKYQLVLRKKGREVARRSQHEDGKAVDFRIPGVSTEALHAYVRSLRLGGVGYYRFSGFVHMDTGPVRFWNGR